MESFYSTVKSQSTSYEPFVGEFLSSFNNIPQPTRYRDCLLLKAIHQDKIPVLIDRGSKETPKIKKNKFLISKDRTLGEVSFILRKYISIDKSQAIFLFINNKIFSGNKLMNDIYEKELSDDLYLRIVYTVENCFGHI